MRTFLLESEMWVDRPVEGVFAFFAEPANLEAITPAWLRFRIEEAPQAPLREGSEIRYRLRVHGLPLRWTSLISHWEPPFTFVDEQVRGPYRSWVHTHTFEEGNGGTLVRDRVEYAVPGGWLVDRLFVSRDLARIFAHRREALRSLLDAKHAPAIEGPSPVAVR